MILLVLDKHMNFNFTNTKIRSRSSLFDVTMTLLWRQDSDLQNLVENYIFCYSLSQESLEYAI